MLRAGVGRHARGGRAPVARRTAQHLRGQRRCGRTVGPHARLPRAVGPRRQRSLPPGSPRDRHRCRRSRRRRARPARAHGPGRARGRRGRAAAPRSAACATIRSCGRGSARTPARRSRRTRTRPGRTQWRVRSRPRGAASVNSPMRRTIFMALLAALLLVPAAAHAADPIEILRDCEDDDVLQGNYTRRRAARGAARAPDRYRRVLPLPRRARARDRGEDGELAQRRQRRRPGGGGSRAAGRRPAATRPAATPAAARVRSSAADSGREQPATPQELKALERGRRRERRHRRRRDAARSRPAGARLAADVGRNGLPTPHDRRAGAARRRGARGRPRRLSSAVASLAGSVGPTSRRGARLERFVAHSLAVPAPGRAADLRRRHAGGRTDGVRGARRHAARAHDLDRGR